MKLITKYRDYYDSLIYSYSSEKIPIWKRTEEEFNLGEYIECLTKEQRDLLIEMSNFSCHRPYYGSGLKDEHLYFRYIIGFCGEVFPVNVLIDDGNIIPYHNIEHMIDVINTEKKYNAIKKNGTLFNSYRSFYGAKLYGLSVKSDAVWLNEYSGLKSVYDIFIALNTPIFMIPCGYDYRYNDNKILIVNPILKDINFQKIKDPFTTFQCIERFLTNDLVVEPQIPEFSDELKRYSHGFDGMSFKNRGKK